MILTKCGDHHNIDKLVDWHINQEVEKSDPVLVNLFVYNHKPNHFKKDQHVGWKLSVNRLKLTVETYRFTTHLTDTNGPCF